jgi:ribulose-5-phosphate 4-epimerase/fuculose-1-phosphate aldolase
MSEARRTWESDLPKELKIAFQLLVSANHILHYHGLVDAFGHISIRHPLNPKSYIIAAYDPGAPALVSNRNDFIEYHVEDSEPVHPPQPKGYSERYIHGELFARFPNVQCVIHSHSEAVIPFMTAKVPIRPVFHMAGFLGAEGPPTFDVTTMYPSLQSYTSDMLIKSRDLGGMLAQHFWDSSTPEDTPSTSVVLQHKHGFTCIGDSIQQAIYRAIYMQKNCALLKDAIDIAGGDAAAIQYLKDDEAQACAKMNELTQDKAFRLWLREVEVNPLYRNDEGIPKSLPVGGMNQN